ncbi:MAG: ssDNA-binding domain-containing protein [Armatimonadetes bacterium]|nr:ssDNA-binding domain-containing protein [Armatimonadota bacterium]
MINSITSPVTSSNFRDLSFKITKDIVRAIREGAADFNMPWNSSAELGLPRNVHSRKAYRGVNILSLWGRGILREYRTPWWGTYQQWIELGCYVRAGERSTPIVFWDTYSGKDPEEERIEDRPKGRPYAKLFHVFNADQVEGFKTIRDEFIRDSFAEPEASDHFSFFSQIPSDVRFCGTVAGYSGITDSIRMPDKWRFPSEKALCSVLAHEHIHWTGHESRLKRNLTGRFGSESYAMEELVAELGAAFTCARLGMGLDPRKDHAPYLATWLFRLENDPGALFSAASLAQRASDYLFEQVAELSEVK